MRETAMEIRFLTNTTHDKRDLVKMAAKNTSFKIITKDDAYDCNGRLIKEYFSIHTLEPLGKDHGPFWREFERLEAEAKIDALIRVVGELRIACIAAQRVLLQRDGSIMPPDELTEKCLDTLAYALTVSEGVADE